MTTFDRGPGGLSRMLFLAWPGIAVALTSIVLLVAFQQVVRGGVQQGEARRKAVAMRADAEWRCKALSGPRMRVDCLLQLDPAIGGGVPLPAERVGRITLR